MVGGWRGGEERGGEGRGGEGRGGEGRGGEGRGGEGGRERGEGRGGKGREGREGGREGLVGFGGRFSRSLVCRREGGFGGRESAGFGSREVWREGLNYSCMLVLMFQHTTYVIVIAYSCACSVIVHSMVR